MAVLFCNLLHLKRTLALLLPAFLMTQTLRCNYLEKRVTSPKNKNAELNLFCMKTKESLPSPRFLEHNHRAALRLAGLDRQSCSLIGRLDRQTLRASQIEFRGFKREKCT